MIKIGPFIIAHGSEYSDERITAMEQQLVRRAAELGAALVNAELLRACMAADAHLHEDPASPAHQLHREAVRELLAAAIGPALTRNGG